MSLRGFLGPLVIVTLGLSACPVPASAQTGLVAAYGFNEGAGTAAADASGNNLTGTVSGAAWSSAGKFGGALTFDGATSWVTVNNSTLLQLTTGMTVEAWVQTATPTDWRCVILKERSAGLSYALYAGDTPGHPASFIRRPADSGDIDATAPSALQSGVWVHVAATYDGATLRTFINGVQVAATAAAGSIQTSTMPLRIGGNAIWGEYFRGTIDEVRIYNRALSATEIQTDMKTPVGGAVPVTYGISGTITPSSAGSGATVSLTGFASATATADANGNFSFAGLGSGPYTVTPSKAGFAFTPASRAVTIGEGGSVTGVNFTASAIPSPTSPDIVGQWGAAFDVGTVAVNMVLLRTGKVLMFSGSYTFSAVERVWDPATGTVTLVPNPYYNLFCAGQAQLPDGRILVAGGHDPSGLGAANANIFDPVSQSWSPLPNMAFRRWYPTVTALPDGRMLVTSGAQSCLTCLADVPEIFNPATNKFSSLTSARLGIDYYPFMFVLPDGRLLSAGSNESAYETRTLNLSTGSWSMVDPVIKDGHSAVMYAPGKVLKTGTAADSGTAGNAANTAYVIDMNQASPTWRQVPSMKFARAFQNMTVLPDGNVLVTGGGTALDGYDVNKGIKTAELWSPASETFTPLSDAAFSRLYHSTALLLPDGRVLIAGSGDDGPAVNNTKAELYSPPYLFKGARPTITAAPDTIQYGSMFTVQTPDTASIASIALIRPGSVTHGFDEDQRFVNLAFSRVNGSLAIQAPVNANTAPPGYYMLFVVNSSGVPSVASFVRFPTASADTAAPSAPANLAAQAGLDSVSLTWIAATDNVAVSGYNVHRSSVAGFAPSTSNRIGVTTATSYTDAGLAPGSYFYAITAQDAAGNVGAPSPEVAGFVSGDTTAPAVAISAPADGSTASGTVQITATASDNVAISGVQFQVDGTPLGAEVPSAPFTASWDASAAADGPHTIAAIARDAAGNRAQSSITVTVSNAPPEPSPDTTAPVVSLTAPANQSTASGTITVTASATDDTAVVGVLLQVDGTPIGAELTAAPYSLGWNTAFVANGAHAVTALARDAAGNTSASSVIVTVFNDSTAPAVTISSPATLSTVGGVVTIAASATDNVGVTSVQFQLDGVAAGAPDTAAPYGMTWNTTAAANGPHTVTAIARDAAGNIGAASVTVTVFNDLLGPTVSITSPASQATVSGTVAVTAAAGDNVGVAGVQISVDGVSLGAEDVSAPYGVNWDTTAASDGAHTLTAVARDAAGNTSSASVTVTVANGIPGLVAAYNFDEGGGTVLSDVSGNGNDGTIRRATYVDGRTGSALSFDGTSYVTILDDASLDLTSGMTLEAWVRPTLTGNIRPVIFKERSVGSSYALFSANSNNGRPAGSIRTSLDRTVTAGSSIPSSTWTHLALTYDGATVRLFVNGVPVATTSASGPIAAGSGVLRIGAAPNSSDYFRGLIDDVRIYNRALTPAQIQADMAAPVK